jgi:hypothetical protein
LERDRGCNTVRVLFCGRENLLHFHV